MPLVNFEPVLSAYRKNIEAIDNSALALSESGRAGVTAQNEILSEVMRRSRLLIDEFWLGEDPLEIATKQVELAYEAFEATIKNVGDVAKLAQESSSAASSIIIDRMRESVAEAHAAVEWK